MTVSFLNKNDKLFEIGKMAVSEKYQGHKINTFLLEHCLESAKKR
ncbi:GNAT family N-acetyltransferase [Polaribacter sp. Asnod1-A03]